jgi:hypothetical protein
MAKDLGLDGETLQTFNDSLGLVDDAVGKVTTKAFDDHLAEYAGILSRYGILSGASKTLVAGLQFYGVAMATLAVYSIVPSVLINTIKNLGTVEEKLRNLKEKYDDMYPAGRSPRIKQYGMDLDDTDFDNDDALKDLATSLGIKQYGEKEMIQHLAADCIKVTDSGIEMKRDSTAMKLLMDNVISHKFYKVIAKEFKRQRAELEKAPEKLYEDMLEYVKKQAANVKAGKSAEKQAVSDFAKAGFDIVFPGANNFATMVFGYAADGATS